MNPWKALLSWSPPSPKDSPLDGVPEHDFSSIQSLVRCRSHFQTLTILLEKLLSCPAASRAVFGGAIHAGGFHTGTLSADCSALV